MRWPWQPDDDTQSLDIIPGYYTRERLRNPPAHWTPLLTASREKFTQPSRPLLKCSERRSYKAVIEPDPRLLDLPGFLRQLETDERFNNFLRGSHR